MKPRIQLIHPAGKKAVSMDKGKYETLKKVLINRLKTKGESTHTELLQATSEEFKKTRTKFEGSVGWHMEWVKLDLEARKKIKRMSGGPVIKFAIAG